jgi:SPP1 gp7 family putative phage head morphogenesis protein
VRSQEEREAEAARNRKRLLAAEAAALALLLSRRKEATDHGIAAGLSLPRIALRIQSGLESGIAEARVLSRGAGIKSLIREVESVGGGFESVLSAPGAGLPRDIRRARLFSQSYAKRWLEKANGKTVARAAQAANVETASALKRTAVTESAEALNRGRTEAAWEVKGPALTLLKVWDSQLDKRTCPTCSRADGTIVGIKENFPHGEPGAVHPWCRCTWTVLTFEERRHSGLIEPKPPAKIISLPSAK